MIRLHRIRDLQAYWPLRWRDQDALVHLADGQATRCRLAQFSIDPEGRGLWSPTGMRQDAVTCITCLGWTPRT